jgi:hypothetical protein
MNTKKLLAMYGLKCYLEVFQPRNSRPAIKKKVKV